MCSNPLRVDAPGLDLSGIDGADRKCPGIKIKLPGIGIRRYAGIFCRDQTGDLASSDLNDTDRRRNDPLKIHRLGPCCAAIRRESDTIICAIISADSYLVVWIPGLYNPDRLRIPIKLVRAQNLDKICLDDP